MINEFKKLILASHGQKGVHELFLDRLTHGGLTRDENHKDHFSVFFLPHDPRKKKLLIGKHKKSGLHLPNGGHIDRGEIPSQTLRREFKEELGLKFDDNTLCSNTYLTITNINNPNKQSCKVHYDFWYFIQLDMSNFLIDKRKVELEYEYIEWINADEINDLKTHPVVEEAVVYLQQNLLQI